MLAEWKDTTTAAEKFKLIKNEEAGPNKKKKKCT